MRFYLKGVKIFKPEMKTICCERDFVADICDNLDFFCEITQRAPVKTVRREAQIHTMMLTKQTFPMWFVHRFKLKRADLFLEHEDGSYSVIEAKFLKAKYDEFDVLGGLTQAMYYSCLLAPMNLNLTAYVVANRVPEIFGGLVEHYNLKGIGFVQWTEGDCWYRGLR